MSFTFNWPRFSDQFHYDAIQMLNTALNKGNKPPIIADKIEVVELEMGTQPPELEIRDIGDLTVDQFRGIFRMTYAGDAHLVLKTKVQANPLNHKLPDIHLVSGSRGMLAAQQPLVVPMLLRLSHFRLSSYVVLVVSKQKGITLVFKTDPLQNVDINSTFDSIAVIQKFIQREIEEQLRQMFREDLPGIIHRLSQQWVKAKVEAPYLAKRPPSRPRDLDTMSSPDLSFHRLNVSNVGLRPHLYRQLSLGAQSQSHRRPPSSSGASVASTRRMAPIPPPTFSPPQPSSSESTFPDLENFDPTYGLRPEGLPTKSVFRGFSSMFAQNKGLADLAEEPSEADSYDDEAGSFDLVDWDDTIPTSTPPQSVYNDNSIEYETIPAVGGGTITRPRIYHSQSQIQSGSSSNLSTLSSRFNAQAGMYSPHFGQMTPGALRANGNFNPYFPEYPPPPSRRTFSSTLGRPISPDSLETEPSGSSSGPDKLSTPSHSVIDATIYTQHGQSERRLSISSSNSNYDNSFQSGSPPDPHPLERDPKIILRPSHNNSIHQLSTLSYSNHTLSPYTRSLSHFTVRSVPPRGAGPMGFTTSMEKQPIKAKRKRTFRLSEKKSAAPVAPDEDDIPHPPSSPVPPSEFDASDMDRYFRSHDDITRSSTIYPTLRRRQTYQPP